MEEKAKEIVGLFLKIAPDQINGATVIDRSAVSSSILLHRMYGKLADAGIIINDYQQLRSFGQLLQQLNGGVVKASNSTNTDRPSFGSNSVEQPSAESGAAGIGIDIEMVSAMPLTGDFREDNFYRMNFSVSEIAYCILQPDPYASFAGLFAAKEAIVKADNRYKGIEFKDIAVLHGAGGKPFHPSFGLSISHTTGLAVAVAVPAVTQVTVSKPVSGQPADQKQNAPALLWMLVLLSLMLSAIAIFLIARKN